MQDKVKKSKIFSKIDIRKEYYKIRIKGNKKWKTAQKLRLGYYEQFVMPFNLINVLISF
jgi:hypothetical protein